MKTRLLALFLAAVLVGFVRQAQAETALTFQDFYDALSPDGDWVELEGYGYCWRPFVDEQWRPYTDGQWVYTDAGYTWFSNEPWGWATYHYGRWTKVKNWGWVWVPGYEWGPAWVSWRANDEYIGWAALPPEAVWQPASGFSIYVDIDYGIGPDWYAFCPLTSFCAPRLQTVCLPWRNNINIINRTENITRIRHGNTGIICNEGPDLAVISRRAESPLRRARLERETNCDVAALKARRWSARLEGDALRIPAPRIESPQGRPRAIAGRAGTSQINRGWEAALKNPEQVDAYRDRMRRDAQRWGRTPHASFTPVSATPVSQSLPQSGLGRNRAADSVPPSADPEVNAGFPPTPPPQNRRTERHNEPATSPDTPNRSREEELRRRLAEQRQQQIQEAQQAELRRPRQPQVPEAPRQSQQLQLEAAEAAQRQRADEARDRLARAQQEAEARREAARQNQQARQEANRQQQQQQAQQQLQRQLEQQREMQQRLHEQIQQQRQNRQNRPPGY